MSCVKWISCGLLVLGLLAGCEKSRVVAPATPAADPAYPGLPTQAQAKLDTIKLYVGTEVMIAEQALAPKEIQTGMMFRTNLAENEGMLFALPYTHQAAFWMKNCPLPLSVAYITSEGVIAEIHDLQPHNTNSVLAATANIRFALETSQGWFERHNVKPGTVIATERGSLPDVYILR